MKLGWAVSACWLLKCEGASGRKAQFSSFNAVSIMHGFSGPTPVKPQALSTNFPAGSQ